MSSQIKFISSHRSRVRRAEEYRKNSPEKISRFDREALVEFYLLEDIVRLYEYRLDLEQKKKIETRAGEMAKKSNIEKFSAIVKIFKSAIEIAWAEITSGNYKAVWSAIPEHALMAAANSLKYLPQLRDLAIKLLRTLSNDALEATEQSELFNESLDEIDDHEANYRTVKGLPSAAEIDEVIRAVEVAIPKDEKDVNKPNPNIN